MTHLYNLIKVMCFSIKKCVLIPRVQWKKLGPPTQKGKVHNKLFVCLEVNGISILPFILLTDYIKTLRDIKINVYIFKYQSQT